MRKIFEGLLLYKKWKKVHKGKIVESNSSDRFDLSFEYEVISSNFLRDEYFTDEITLFGEYNDELKDHFLEIESNLDWFLKRRLWLVF